MHRVVIAGSRGFGGRYSFLLDDVCDALIGDRRVVVLSGMAGGADRLGYAYALRKGFEVESYPAQWDVHGKSAGYIRNVVMAERADTLIAFWDMGSRGTGHMVSIGRERGLSVYVYDYINRRMIFDCDGCNRMVRDVAVADWGDRCPVCGRGVDVLLKFE